MRARGSGGRTALVALCASGGAGRDHAALVRALLAAGADAAAADAAGCTALHEAVRFRAAGAAACRATVEALLQRCSRLQPPPPSSRTKWTRLVHPAVLSGRDVSARPRRAAR